ncbi:hypothetical protein HAX54_029007 [Datura stramonium]|uniref:Pentatricopeptide repeat-containing protein n=1 Tax=Datura stramonium TaxID=4076 RepID=A0ABS8V6E8_DATST|nr:hypothetical protein [Datura stramonium]
MGLVLKFQLEVLCQRGKFSSMIASVFRRMPARDLVSWNSMMSGLSQNGCGTEALELFEEMLLEGTRPDYVTFVNILSACSHMGLVKRGWNIFKMMSDEFGIEPRLEHFACMVDMFGRAGKLYDAKEFIESAAIMLTMLLEDWRMLERFRRLMNIRGVSKEPGCSWIDLKSQFHVFVVGDQLHPQIVHIREELWRLSKLMKDEGYKPDFDPCLELERVAD